MAEKARKVRPRGRPRREDAPPPVEVRVQEALRMMRSGDFGITVAPLLAEKYNTSDRKARDWVAKARELLAEENAAAAKSWSTELVAAVGEAYRLAKAKGDIGMMLQASDRLWEMTGNKVTRTEVSDTRANPFHERARIRAELEAQRRGEPVSLADRTPEGNA